MSELLAIGVSHKTAPVEVRERLALPDATGRRFPARPARSGRHPRGGRGLDVQPDRALPGRRRSGRGREPGAGDAGHAGRYPPDRARVGDLLASQLRRRAPPLPGHGRARVDGRRRGRDPGPGQARLRRRARQGDGRPAHQPPVQGRAGRRQARAHRDRYRRTPAQPAGRRRDAGPRAARSARRPRGCDHRHRGDERARRARPRRQRRAHRVRRQPPARSGDRSRPPLRRDERQLR